ncbi:hypothetical protein E4H12_00140 [Candidatus Thorarchaeota archaeon]|nr:MAG: hypothetical protein E4H12_00140 [Candidatus Thorarchaeota archaeon]
MQQQEIERALLLATALMSVNLFIGFISLLILQTVLVSTIAGGGAFLEFGFLLIIGSCLMSRQPLENKDRYNEDGTLTKAWRFALFGQRLMFAALFLFLYFVAVSVAGTYLGF